MARQGEQFPLQEETCFTLCTRVILLSDPVRLPVLPVVLFRVQVLDLRNSVFCESHYLTLLMYTVTTNYTTSTTQLHPMVTTDSANPTTQHHPMVTTNSANPTTQHHPMVTTDSTNPTKQHHPMVTTDSTNPTTQHHPMVTTNSANPTTQHHPMVTTNPTKQHHPMVTTTTTQHHPMVTTTTTQHHPMVTTTTTQHHPMTDHNQYGWATVSSTLTLSTGASQGCVLSPLLYSLYTYDCTATSSSTIIVKFADDTVVMGLILDNDERAYLEEIKHLENWCQENNLLLNVSKTKELIVDCSKKQERHYQPVRISGTTVERVDSFRYLGVHISQDLSWSRHTNSLAKKARQRLYHLRRLKGFRLPSKVLRNFYTCTIESILTGNITVWFGNSIKQDRQALQRVVRSAERITHTELPDLQTIYYKRCQTKARRIVKDPTHPNNRLFSWLRSEKRFHSLKTKTERLKRSFFPQAIRALNQGN
ncbi:hypothetical protein P4O66_007711 [Electrophorus voltai]|uniref:Reverse transcriptase domain-containing protein n=1 Tax=Electrophorus voltai TaxID=2609070 RepID=A0AAD9DZ78_9TELE|nr:hypothetical protein P4O66_007711 [Electrophorus voltai]